MNLLDLIVCGVIVAAIAVGANRRFGKTIFDLVAILAAAHLTPGAATLLRSWSAMGMVACSMVTFVALAAGFLALARCAHALTQWSVGNLDATLGGALGFFTGCALAHVLVSIWILSAGPRSGLPPEVASSTLGREVITFSTYHNVLKALHNFGV